MSADNGIYIVKMPISGMTTHFNNCPCTEGDSQEICCCFEYRVIHAMAIDNLTFIPELSDLKSIPPADFTFEFGNPQSIVDYLQDTVPILNRDDAFAKAVRMYDDSMSSNFPIIEYGISTIDLAKPYNWYYEQAKYQPKYRWED
jgi:hypothetical protein